MSSYKQVQILKQPKPGQDVTESLLYWKDYEVQYQKDFFNFAIRLILIKF